MDNIPKEEVVSTTQPKIDKQISKSQMKLVTILLILVLVLLGIVTYFLINDEILEIPFVKTKIEETEKEETSDVTKEEEDNTQTESSTKFYIDDEDNYILEDNGWVVKASYTIVNNYVDKEVKGYNLSCLWTIPENDVWILEKDDVELNIERYYPEPNTCDGYPTTVGEGYESLDYELNYTNSLGNKLYLMKNENNGIYTYRFALKNSLYDVRDGLEVYYPDTEYFHTGELYFIYDGNDTQSIEAEILNLYEDGGSGWWSWK
ncbi:MAG: hypothetical protein PHP08_04115 [Candidatus Dojkabacteria bacterium]|nr:hypothetical protein [Candidatus Dojkabacteria bacterium]